MVLHDDARILGLDDFIFEAGAGFAIDDELHWLAEPDTHERIAASGAPDLLLERYRGRLEPHTPYSEGREVSHILRGHVDIEEARALLQEHGHDDLRLIDNGEAHHHSTALADLPSVRLYHLLPTGISKPAGVAAHMRARGLRPEECVAVGDSGEDLSVAGVVGALWLVANAFEHDPALRPALARHPTPTPPRRPTAPASTRPWSRRSPGGERRDIGRSVQGWTVTLVRVGDQTAPRCAAGGRPGDAVRRASATRRRRRARALTTRSRARARPAPAGRGARARAGTSSSRP